LTVKKNHVRFPRPQGRETFDSRLFLKPQKGSLAANQIASVFVTVKDCDLKRPH
jgi:hypothetical protein